MPTIKENILKWNTDSIWEKGGEDWSSEWGSSERQWQSTIFPRLHHFVPVETILEIGPGFGRWTRFLKDLSKNLVIVDLSDKLIDACRKRFSSCDHITYHVNDGKSLDMIPDGSIDFVFSFDSLVFCEQDVIESYVDQLAKKLKTDGVGFIHHSNLGEYKTYFSIAGGLISLTSKVSNRLLLALLKLGIVEDDHWRAKSVTAKIFEECVEKAGMSCISQEIVNWRTTTRLIDCISIFTQTGSRWERPNKIVKNRDFAHA